MACGRTSRRTAGFTSIARAINHFKSAESLSAMQSVVRWQCFVFRGLTRTANPVDHPRSRKSKQIEIDWFGQSSGRVLEDRHKLPAGFPRWLVHVVAKLETRNDHRISKWPSIVGLRARSQNWLPPRVAAYYPVLTAIIFSRSPISTGLRSTFRAPASSARSAPSLPA